MLQRLEDGLLDGQAVGRVPGDPGDPGPGKDVSPESSSRPGLRQAANPRNVAVESAGAFPVAGAPGCDLSARPLPAVVALSDTGGYRERVHCRRSVRLYYWYHGCRTAPNGMICTSRAIACGPDGWREAVDAFVVHVGILAWPDKPGHPCWFA
jgi:hypothetical protein